MQSHLIDRPCPLVRRPVRWSVLRAGEEGSAIKQSNRKNQDPPPLPEGYGLCSVGQGQVDLNQAEPFISYAGAYVQCLGDPALDAVD